MTLLVYTLELRVREGEYSVLKAPPLEVSRDEIELCVFGYVFVHCAQCVNGPVCYVCMLSAHFFPGLNEYANDDFSASVCVCAGVCVSVCPVTEPEV